MATKTEFDFFKGAYDEEIDRERQLRDYAKTYLTLQTLYSGFLLFVVEKRPPSAPLTTGIFAAAATVFVLGLIGSILVLNVAMYSAPVIPRKLAKEIDDEQPDEPTFLSERAADYTVAYERNKSVNNKKAILLYATATSFAFGIALHAVYLILELGVWK